MTGSFVEKRSDAPPVVQGPPCSSRKTKSVSPLAAALPIQNRQRPYPYDRWRLGNWLATHRHRPGPAHDDVYNKQALRCSQDFYVVLLSYWSSFFLQRRISRNRDSSEVIAYNAMLVSSPVFGLVLPPPPLPLPGLGVGAGVGLGARVTTAPDWPICPLTSML